MFFHYYLALLSEISLTVNYCKYKPCNLFGGQITGKDVTSKGLSASFARRETGRLFSFPRKTHTLTVDSSQRQAEFEHPQQTTRKKQKETRKSEDSAVVHPITRIVLIQLWNVKSLACLYCLPQHDDGKCLPCLSGFDCDWKQQCSFLCSW